MVSGKLECKACKRAKLSVKTKNTRAQGEAGGGLCCGRFVTQGACQLGFLGLG